MAKAMKTCRVCGKSYEACRTPNPNNVFRWRDVACSPECGQAYLARVLESRKPIKETIEEDVVTTDVIIEDDDIADIDDSLI